MGLENIGGAELVVIILVLLFIFGPDRLPKAISEGVRMLRNLRQMARNATGDLSRELGTNIELEDLHPKTFLRKHLLSEADEAAIRKPLNDIYGDLRGVRDSFDLNADPGPPPATTPRTPAPRRPGPTTYDIDAT
jgi:sec-independent protein translocase protein TatB